MKPTNPGDFRLPPDVSFRKQRLNDGWAYVFRHRTLGELGRILIQDTSDGHSRISCEVVGDPADPKTAERMAAFKPLSLELAGHVEAAKGTVPEAQWGPLPPPPPNRREGVPQSSEQERTVSPTIAVWSEGGTDHLVPVIMMSLASARGFVCPRNQRSSRQRFL